MKKALLLSWFSLYYAQANTPLIDNINKTLNQLKIETQQEHTALNVSYDPFYHDKRPIKKVQAKSTSKNKIHLPKKSISLSMILNKKAFINGRWYRQDEKVAQYVLEEVNEDSVLLRQKHKYIVLKLKTAKNLLVKTEVK